MALRTIYTDDDPVLRKKAREVTVFDDKLHTLLDDMYDTMKAADGVGLAAPQIGILRRVVVIEVEEGKRIELVNPVITMMKGKQCKREGCLSLPGKNGFVERPAKVKVMAQDRFGKEFTLEGKELLAVAICHETDHLNGILFIDKEVPDPNEK